MRGVLLFCKVLDAILFRGQLAGIQGKVPFNSRVVGTHVHGPLVETRTNLQYWEKQEC